jgi:hypothetical protein
LRIKEAQGLSTHLLAAALASLPHLTSLMLGDGAVDAAGSFIQVLSAASGQLTRPALCGEPAEPGIAVNRVPEGSNIPLSMRQLRRIDLSGITMDDALLIALTSNLPLLTHVEVTALALCTSHANTACRWEVLSAIGNLSMDDLIHLPLRGIRTLELYEVRSHGSTTAPALAAALAAAPDCVLTCPCSPGPDIECDAEELSVLLPRLHCKATECLTLSSLKSGCLTPAAVGALASLLERTPSCTELHISYCGPPDPESAPLLPALRNTAIRRVLLIDSKLTEAQLLSWCAGRVGRPIVLQWGEGVVLKRSLKRVHRALKAAVSDVRLVDEGCDDDFSREHEECYEQGCECKLLGY